MKKNNPTVEVCRRQRKSKVKNNQAVAWSEVICLEQHMRCWQQVEWALAERELVVKLPKLGLNCSGSFTRKNPPEVAGVSAVPVPPSPVGCHLPPSLATCLCPSLMVSRLVTIHQGARSSHW